ncbi:MAG: hypothetical protein HYS80_00980, partial [Candidatus Aenigmarchaeota archaeon]|nr:hypothetical protein [Candidatus Aenigmarchaeota archaeon]
HDFNNIKLANETAVDPKVSPTWEVAVILHDQVVNPVALDKFVTATPVGIVSVGKPIKLEKSYFTNSLFPFAK